METMSRRPLSRFFENEFGGLLEKTICWGYFSSWGGTWRPPGSARVPPEVTESFFHRFVDVPGPAFEGVWRHLGLPLSPFGTTWAHRGAPQAEKKVSRDPVGYTSRFGVGRVTSRGPLNATKT